MAKNVVGYKLPTEKALCRQKRGKKAEIADSGTGLFSAVDKAMTRARDWFQKKEPAEACSANDCAAVSRTGGAAGAVPDEPQPAGKEADPIVAALPENCLVVHEVAARYGSIENLVIRKDGAVFLIETEFDQGKITQEEGELMVDGRPFDEDLIRQTTTNAFVLRDVLADGLGISPLIHAAIVFPNATVAIRRAIYGVDVIEAEYLRKWMAKARGNADVAKLVAVTWGGAEAA